LAGNKLGAEGANFIAEALRVNGSLTSLNVSYNKLGPEGVKELAAGLAVSGSLTVCTLLKNDLNMEAASSLAGLGKEKNISLSGITRDQTEANYAHWSLQPADAVLLAADLSNEVVSASLTSIDVGYNQIAQAAALELLAIMKGKKMVSIGMAGCNLGPEGAKEMAELVSVSASLTSINVGFNNIGQAAALELLAVMEVKKSMVSVGMASCSLGVEGAKEVAELVSVSGSLTEVNLRNNWLGSEGAKFIADALRVNGSLTSLNVRFNNLGDAGEAALKAANEARIKNGVPELSLNL